MRTLGAIVCGQTCRCTGDDRVPIVIVIDDNDDNPLAHHLCPSATDCPRLIKK